MKFVTIDAAIKYTRVEEHGHYQWWAAMWSPYITRRIARMEVVERTYRQIQRSALEVEQCIPMWVITVLLACSRPGAYEPIAAYAGDMPCLLRWCSNAPDPEEAASALACVLETDIVAASAYTHTIRPWDRLEGPFRAAALRERGYDLQRPGR